MYENYVFIFSDDLNSSGNKSKYSVMQLNIADAPNGRRALNKVSSAVISRI
jgi:hypothetical protein